jgi:hypothetical protein
VKRFLSLLVVTAVALVAASAAKGFPPTHSTQTAQFTLTNPTACGDYGVAWSIDLVADVTTFFDDGGRRTRLVQHISEDNTVQNTVTGLTLRDGPVNVVQTTHFEPATQRRELITISGTSLNVRRGGERLVDTGHLVIDGQTGEILFSAGPHPIRELLDGSFNINLALPGFCNILR